MDFVIPTQLNYSTINNVRLYGEGITEGAYVIASNGTGTDKYIVMSTAATSTVSRSFLYNADYKQTLWREKDFPTLNSLLSRL